MAIAVQLFLTRPPSHPPPFHLHPSPPFILLSLLFFFGVPPLCVSAKVSRVSVGFFSQNPTLLFADWEHISRMSAPLFGLVRAVQTHPQAQTGTNFICLLNLWPRQIKIKPTVCVKAERFHRPDGRQDVVVCSLETDNRVR